MRHPTIERRRAKRAGWLAGVSMIALAAPVMVATPATAIEFDFGEVSGSFDTTITAGLSFRVQDRDADLIARASGGNRNSSNGDDGNLNYDTGLISSLIKATHELELNYQDYGLFVRGSYFYDFENEDGNRERTELSDSAKEQVGSDIELLDAFIYGGFDVAERPVDFRVGNQVLNWGESTFIQNGVNVINPVDVGALRQPGAELREALLPVPIVSGSVSLTENLSFEAFYQALWEEIEVDEPGTYFSTNDFIGDGGTTVILGSGAAPDIPPFAPGTAVARAPDDEPSDAGQFGAALRYFSPALNDTEFGLYFVNYHSRLPLISARTGTDTTNQATLVAGSRYFIEYPEDIQLVGVSFNTQLPSGIALQGEYTFRKDQPFQVDDAEIFLAALSPLNPALFGQGQLGVQGLDSEVSGFRELDMSQVQMTATQAFGPMLGADQFVLLGEAGATYVHGMPDKSELRFDGPGTDTSGNPVFTGITQPVTTTSGFADPFSWGYRLAARLTFNNAVGAINLNPSVSFQHDVNGTTPLPIGNFVEDRKAISVALGADYLNSWTGEVRYTTFFDAGSNNLINDRDFVSLNLKYSF